jgi:hypothetical protein
MVGSGAAHSVRGPPEAAKPKQIQEGAAMASFGGGELYRMVGDLRSTVGMTNLRFRQK